MEALHYNTIKRLQKENGLSDMQESINNGSIWKFEGSVGRNAMGALECGACMLPKENTYDYYGSKLPSRTELKNGTKGTFGNSQRFWSNPENYIDFD